mgnify:CR=1 FL=1
MEANLVKSDVLQRRTIYDGCLEIGVESDIVLPDYCGDIERILKCTLTPRLSSKNVENDRLSVGGMAFLRMVYQTGDGKLSAFETQLPFSKSVDLQGACDPCCVTVRLRTEFASCSAISPRRFEVRGALSMKACVRCAVAVPVVTDIDEENIEVRRCSIDAIVPVASVCDTFTILEEYEHSGPPLSCVLRMTAVPTLIDTKIISGKLLVKGEIALTVIYLPEDGDQPQSVSYSLPVNPILSISDAEEGDRADVRLEISRMSVQPSRRGDVNELGVEILLGVCAEITRQSPLQTVSDAYSTVCACNCSRSDFSFVSLEEPIEHCHTLTLTPEDSEGELLDVFAELRSESFNISDQGEVLAEGELTVETLLRNADGSFSVTEKAQPFRFSVAADERFRQGTVDGMIQLRSAEQVRGKREIRLELCAYATVTKIRQQPLLTGIQLQTDTPLCRSNDAALTLYFADSGEDAFDIAKRYCTSAQAVMAENGLESTRLEQPKMLLIPMV